MVPNVALDDLYGVCCELHNIVDSLFESVKSSFVDECRLGGLGNYAIYFKLIGPDKFNVCMKFAENIYPLLINKWFFTYTQSNKLYRYEINNGRSIKGPGYNYATHFKQFIYSLLTYGSEISLALFAVSLNNVTLYSY